MANTEGDGATGLRLNDIGVTFGVGLSVAAASIFAFGTALKCRHVPSVAPRCHARHPYTVYKPKKAATGPDDPQIRGSNAYFGWIKWCMSLTYDQMLEGVPGTGTIEKGMGGRLLDVNLDGIVFLKFIDLCRRVCVVQTILAMLILFPLNWTSWCYNNRPEPGEEDNDWGSICGMGSSDNNSTSDYYNMTDYVRTTISNIPSLSGVKDQVNQDVLSEEEPWRLYLVAIVTWITSYYTIRLIRHEWVTMIAMRRSYYLEAQHHDEYKDDLRSVKRLDLDRVRRRNAGHREDIQNSNGVLADGESRRDAWIPDPGEACTVPNIELYSLLVKNIPDNPEDVLSAADIESGLYESVDWQLELIRSFFHQCIPAQPGYSSSVAAITVLPEPTKIAEAWRKWYKAKAALRRLAYVRAVIADKFSVDNTVKYQYGSYVDMIDVDQDHETLTAFESVQGQSLTFGPSQNSIYQREVAQGASNCCPYGCCQERLHFLEVEDLQEIEQKLLTVAAESSLGLRRAQTRAAAGVKPQPDSNRSIDTTSGLRDKSNSLEKDKGEYQDTDMDKDDDSFRSIGSDSDCISDDGSIPAAVKFLVGPDGRMSMSIGAGNEATIRTENVQRLTENSGVRRRSVAWARAESKVDESSLSVNSLDSGAWFGSNISRLSLKHVVKGATNTIAAEVNDAISKELHRGTNMAVVTFTSRQAAISARRCMVDGRPNNKWSIDQSLAIPPLADAAPFDVVTCRGLCKPVTPTIPETRKTLRRYIANAGVVLAFLGYTYPISKLADLLDETSAFYKFIQDLIYPIELPKNTNGILTALLYMVTFASCPIYFKMLANTGSNATNLFGAEQWALRAYWYFMLLVAFTGSTLFRVGEDIIRNEFGTDTLWNTLQEISGTIPNEVSAAWINWIILRACAILPAQYLLQYNVISFALFGLKCCVRVSTGGGPGGPLPYRIYVDSGVVFLCAVALSCASPIVAPCALLYFTMGAPIWRRQCIFVYRPLYDAGGGHWPLLANM